MCKNFANIIIVALLILVSCLLSQCLGEVRKSIMYKETNSSVCYRTYYFSFHAMIQTISSHYLFMAPGKGLRPPTTVIMNITILLLLLPIDKVSKLANVHFLSMVMGWNQVIDPWKCLESGGHQCSGDWKRWQGCIRIPDRRRGSVLAEVLAKHFPSQLACVVEDTLNRLSGGLVHVFAKY